MMTNPVTNTIRKIAISSTIYKTLILLGISFTIIVMKHYLYQNNVERFQMKAFNVSQKNVFGKLQREAQNLESGMTSTKTLQPSRFIIDVETTTPESRLMVAPLEVKHVAYLKVHKTGSTTAQNIFLRFGVDRNLTFLLASIEHNECGGWANCISYYNTLTDNNTWAPPANKSFDILCSHVIFNKNSFRKYLPEDTRFIGIVRDPITRLESAIAFFRLLKDIPLSAFASNPIKHNHAMMNNRMAFEFGFNKELFPNSTQRTLPDTKRKEALDYIDLLNKEFTLIIVNERYEESLVLMKRMLNWKTKDIVYIHRGKQQKRKFDKNDEIKLKEYLYLDYMLYDYAVKEFDRKIALTGADFMEEVHDFHSLSEKVRSYCVQVKYTKHRQALILKASAWYDDFSVDWNDCAFMIEQENLLIRNIRQRQYTTTKR